MIVVNIDNFLLPDFPLSSGKIPHSDPLVSFSPDYRIYSIKRPGRLLNFWTLRVSTYSRWAFIKFLDLESGRLFEVGAY